MKKNDDLAISLNWKTLFLPLFTLLLILAGAYVIYELRLILTVLLISVVIAYLLEPVASMLESRGLSRGLATLAIFAGLGFIVLLFVAIVLPSLLEQIKHIQVVLSGSKIETLIASLEAQLQAFLPEDLGINIREDIGALFSSLSSGALRLALSFLSTLSFLVVIPVAVFFFIKDGYDLKNSFIRLIPNRYFEMVLTIIHKIDVQLGGYLRGILVDAGVIGILATFALWIIGSPYFALIGFFAGLANMIPYVGPLAGAILAILVNFFVSGNFDLTLSIAIAFAIIQIIDNALVQPYVISKNVAVHPVTIIFAIIIGGKVFGLLGMFFAVPVVSILKVTAFELYAGIQKYGD